MQTFYTQQSLQKYLVSDHFVKFQTSLLLITFLLRLQTCHDDHRGSNVHDEIPGFKPITPCFVLSSCEKISNFIFTSRMKNHQLVARDDLK